MGVKIKGSWGFLFAFEFYGFLEVAPRLGIDKFVYWIFLLLSHGIVFLLPFMVRKSYYSTALIYAPIVFVVAYSLLNFAFFFMLLPFIFFWIISLFLLKDVKNENRKMAK
ncbi:hypothetical protein AQF98_14855 [Pedobacter sp. Hv1]|nr:hypothetical protein AQF98_14855 [Pedobacter sp. Hv1]